MSFEFPIKNFAERCHDLKWVVLPISTEHGFYCESCLTKFPYTDDGLLLSSIVDREPSDDIMKHCTGRVLPCCIDCGIKHGIVTKPQIDSLTLEDIHKNMELWREEVKEIDRFCSWINEHIRRSVDPDKLIQINL